MVNKNLDLYLEKAKERRNKGISIAIPHYNMSNMIVNCINSLKENLKKLLYLYLDIYWLN